jgi:hypothetical protein
MATNDKTWELNLNVKVTTMNGWEPDRSDIESWLENGGVLELLSFTVKESNDH